MWISDLGGNENFDILANRDLPWTFDPRGKPPALHSFGNKIFPFAWVMTFNHLRRKLARLVFQIHNDDSATWKLEATGRR